jgi:multidrug efflux pump subunit AcrB
LGLLASTVLTLAVIPVVYDGVMRKRVEWIRTATG